MSPGVAPDRAYGDWREMLAGERGRADRIDLVTVATPNSTHYEITKAFLGAGIAVLCEKPMTVTVEEAEDIVVRECGATPKTAPGADAQLRGDGCETGIAAGGDRFDEELLKLIHAGAGFAFPVGNLLPERAV